MSVIEYKRIPVMSIKEFVEKHNLKLVIQESAFQDGKNFLAKIYGVRIGGIYLFHNNLEFADRYCSTDVDAVNSIINDLSRKLLTKQVFWFFGKKLPITEIKKITNIEEVIRKD